MPAVPRQCRECGGAVKGRAVRDLCPECKGRFCSSCDALLPPGVRVRQCAKCRRAIYDRYWEKPGRRCRRCGTGTPTPRGDDCSECRRQLYEERLAIALRRHWPCLDCKEPLPLGRTRLYCRDCEKVRDAGQPARQGRTPCATCKTRRRLKGQSYCRPCQLLRRNLWHAATYGDGLDRLAYPMKKRKARQQKETP